MESDLDDDIYKLMSDFDKESVFEKVDSEKDNVSDDQPNNILSPESNIIVIEGRGENPKDSKKRGQENRVPLNWLKKILPHRTRRFNLFTRRSK